MARGPIGLTKTASHGNGPTIRLGSLSRPRLALLFDGSALLTSTSLITWMLWRGNGLTTTNALLFRYGTPNRVSFDLSCFQM